MMFYFSFIVFYTFYLHLEVKILFPDKGISNIVIEKLCRKAEKPSHSEGKLTYSNYVSR